MNGNNARGICRDVSQTRLITTFVSFSPKDAGRALTEILHILVTQQHHDYALWFHSWLDSCSVGFEDDNTISRDCRYEGKTVAERRPARFRIEGDVGESVAEDCEEEGSMTNEPTLRLSANCTSQCSWATYELQCGRKLLQTLSEGHRCGRWRGHRE